MSKSTRWALLVSSVAVLGATLVLAFVLGLSTSGLISERHFIWLFWVNVGVAALLQRAIGGEELAGRRIGVIVSGRNVDGVVLRRVLCGT